MNILVTGGAGFIGSHLVEKLLEKENNIIVIDNFSMGKMENLPEHNNLSVITADILGGIGTFFEDIDVVYHLAALTRPRESFVNPIETNRVNVQGTLETLINARDNGVKKFIFVSSASAYGYQTKYPFDEFAMMKPASPYALTKLIGEQYCNLFSVFHDMDINCVRPFNVYGNRQDPKGEYAAAVPKFIDALKKGKQPFITGDGKQFRDFVYVDDVVDFMIRLAKSGVKGETFNVGSGKHTTINALYETITEIMKSKVVPTFTDPVPDPNTLAGMAKAEGMLKWKPKYSLIEGLLEMTGRMKK